MIRRTAIIAFAGISACGAGFADFTYEQTSTMTGGAMMAMMKVAGAFSKQAREPIKTTHIIKGDKMATVSNNRVTVIDLASETITEIDMQKKQYSVMTFVEMKQMLDAMAEKTKSGGSDAEANFKVSVDTTGATRKINGYDAKQMIIKMEMEMKDKKSEQAGTMTIVTDSWFASGISGYNEVREFQKRMAEKLAWTPGGGMMMNRPDVAKGMASAMKELAKVDGVPILQLVKMGGANPNMTPEQREQMAQAQQQRQQQQQAQQQQPQPSVGGALGGALGGRLGRFGGLGKKKEPPKEEAQPQPQQQQQQPAAAQRNAPASDPSSLMEMTTEMTSFSAGPADAARFEVPAGFKKVTPDKRR
jgi:hypothetical protein